MKQLLKYFLLFLSFLLVSAFAYYLTSTKQQQAKVKALPPSDEHYSKSLPSLEAFMQFQGEPLSAKFTQVASVKVVWDIRSNQLFFINNRFYVYHYEFCNQVLSFQGDINLFNSFNYTENVQQSYYLANLNYYIAQKKFALEFTSGTRYEAKSFQSFVDLVQQHSFIKDSLYILAGSSYLLDLAEQGALKVPVLYPDDIYKHQNYQCLQVGEAYGYLKVLEDVDKDIQKVDKDDIILFKGSPTQIPVCVGMLTQTFQTPLSHVQLLARGRGIPAAVIKDIFAGNTWQALEGKPVKLVVTNQGYVLEAASEEDVQSFMANRPSHKPIKLTCNQQEKNLLSAGQLRYDAVDKVGTKAAALGELQWLANKGKHGFKTPEGMFAIPFYYYFKHVSQASIQLAYQQLLLAQGANQTKEALKALRDAIKVAPIDTGLLRLVSEKIQANHQGLSYRFRSSSNAEDLDGFSGAGLYTSKTGILNDKDKSIEKAIKAVWASVWSEAAYRERYLKNIQHQTVGMAIVCHRNFPDEAANGVAITKNLYRPSFGGFTVNVQVGEHSVVEPAAGITCEQMILVDHRNVNPLDKGVGADYVSASSLTNGKRVLNKQQLATLYKALMAVKEHFYYQTYLGEGLRDDFESFALDIEFKFEQSGELYLKQVRYFLD
jgi:pyruvate, water dikinase